LRSASAQKTVSGQRCEKQSESEGRQAENSEHQPISAVRHAFIGQWASEASGDFQKASIKHRRDNGERKTNSECPDLKTSLLRRHVRERQSEIAQSYDDANRCYRESQVEAHNVRSSSPSNIPFVAWFAQDARMANPKSTIDYFIAAQEIPLLLDWRNSRTWRPLRKGLD
jgi:hypothetical protein